MSSQSALVKGGSLRLLMDELVGVYHKINDAMPALKAQGLLPGDLPSLEVNRWRPAQISPPSIYTLVAPSPFAQEDQLRWRDTINLLVRIAVKLESDTLEMDVLEPLTDLFRETVDPLLVSVGTRPFNGAAQWAERSDMRSVTDEFNDIPYPCMEFVIQARLDRMIHPT